MSITRVNAAQRGKSRNESANTARGILGMSGLPIGSTAASLAGNSAISSPSRAGLVRMNGMLRCPGPRQPEPCRTSVSCTLATIHMQDLAGDEAGILQIEDRVDDVVDLAETTDRMQCRQGVVGRRIVHRGADYPERDSVTADTAAGVFDRQRLGHRVQPALGQ